MTELEAITGLAELVDKARALLKKPLPGQPEANTKGRLIEPALELLGYTPDHRTWESSIPSFSGATQWVDYMLSTTPRGLPHLMLEAKPLTDTNLWEVHKDQVLRYIRDYLLVIPSSQKPIVWVCLTNFREWHFIRVNDRQPFWSFTMEDLEDATFARLLYQRLAREEFQLGRLLEFYEEHQREQLGRRFLADLKTWRLILANGIREANASLTLEEITRASHEMLTRLLLLRILEAYGREPFFSLGNLHYLWTTAFQNLNFIQLLRQKFQDTWLSYNTELFASSWIDDIDIPNAFLEPLILPDASPQGRVWKRVASSTQLNYLDYRSIYNYDFTTLTHDLLGVAYEQFLAHHLIETEDGIRITENAETRKREGIFYTPSIIVDYIVNTALFHRVTTPINDAINDLQDGHFDLAYETASAIFDLRVIDPACGSGSFLLRAFDFLLSEIERYNEAADHVTADLRKEVDHDAGLPFQLHLPKKLSDVEERILVHILHGVDLDPQAVSLAKLSLWTRLLRSKPGRYGRTTDATSRLPALTLNVRIGNSLIAAPHQSAVDSSIRSECASAVMAAKDVSLSTQARVAAVDKFERLRATAVRELDVQLLPFFAHDQQIHAAAADATEHGAVASISGLREILASSGNSDATNIFQTLLRDETALAEVAKFRPFHWEIEFPDVFSPTRQEHRRGFDIAIGNPPYFNVDATFGQGARQLLWLRWNFPEIHTDKTDILFYFLRQAARLLNCDGDAAFIVSRSFLQAAKAEKLRTFLSSNTTLSALTDFLGHRVFSAGIATAIIHYRNSPPPPDHQFPVHSVFDFDRWAESQHSLESLASNVLHREVVLQHTLTSATWSFGPYQHLFALIDSRGRKLAEWPSLLIGQGMQTGANQAFVLSQDQVDSLGIPEEVLKVRASDIRPFQILPRGEYVLFLEDFDFSSVPKSVQDWLNQDANQSALKGRAAYSRGDCEWFKFSWPLHSEYHFNPKIICSYRGPSNRFAVDSVGQFLGLTNTTVICFAEAGIDPFAVCALLNSLVLDFRYRALGGLGKLTGRGMFEYFESQVGNLPLPPVEDNETTYRRLAELGSEAHSILSAITKVTQAYQDAGSSIFHRRVPLLTYLDTAGPYGDIVTWESPTPESFGHLLELDIHATAAGFSLWANVTFEDDWQEGDRQWLELVTAETQHASLRRFLVAAIVHQLQLDLALSRKRKLTSKYANLVRAALSVLSVPLFDDDPGRNLITMDRLQERVESLAGRSDIERMLVRKRSILEEIDCISMDFYGLSNHEAVIRQALQTVL